MSATPAEVAAVLDAAAELIETKGWTRGAFARNAHGYSVSAREPDATCYCLEGALVQAIYCRRIAQDRDAVDKEVHRVLGREVRRLTRPKPRYVALSQWSDSQRSPAPAIALLRDTAARVRAEAAQ